MGDFLFSGLGNTGFANMQSSTQSYPGELIGSQRISRKITGPTMTYSSATQNVDAQYVASVRNTKSSYGRKRKRTLSAAWRDIERSRRVIHSRFQSFATGGLAVGLGTHPVVYEAPLDDLANEQLPAWCFRLSSLPNGRYWSDISGPATQLQPLVAYRLTSTTAGPIATTGKQYAWSNSINNDSQLNPGGSGKLNIYQEIDRSGEALTSTTLKSFKHEYSDVKLTFYPQTALPTTYNVYLCKWKPEFPAWPYSQGYRDNTNTVETVYAHNALLAVSQKQADVTAMWDRYWSGRLLHPHNTKRTQIKELPFNVLKHESFLVPARDGADRPVIRTLKKFFFRNDRVYKSETLRRDVEDNNLPAGSFEYGQYSAVSGSPMCKPDDEVWLMITASGFKKRTNSAPLTLPTEQFPSFDIVINNKHSFKDNDIDDNAEVFGPPGARARTEEPLLATTDSVPAPLDSIKE